MNDKELAEMEKAYSLEAWKTWLETWPITATTTRSQSQSHANESDYSLWREWETEKVMANKSMHSQH
ncbi:hypothetical protein GBA52_017734 [Prunus armeniaca]|nr:hypothetical protein GBA52_017734 [Prunus armeniaca]